MPPVISIVGYSNSGKTTFIEKLVDELKSRGYRVAAIKHTSHKIQFDMAGKDSWRYIQAGSDAAAVCSSDMIVMMKPVNEDVTLDEITCFLGEDYDIVLAEGFKQSNAPKIEVHRRDTGPLLKNMKKLIGIVSDEPLSVKTRQFSPDNFKEVCDLLEKGFIKPSKERILLHVNNIPILLTSFPRKIICNTLLAMISCLKGVKEVKNLRIFWKRE